MPPLLYLKYAPGASLYTVYLHTGKLVIGDSVSVTHYVPARASAAVLEVRSG